MANEARISYNIDIVKGNAVLSRSGSFAADISTGKGPAPGAFAVTTAGVDVDLSELATPQWAEFLNISDTGIVDWGIWDGTTFYPIGELSPGEGHPLKLSSLLFQEYGTGAGTSGPSINTLRFKARTVSVNVSVLAMDA